MRSLSASSWLIWLLIGFCWPNNGCLLPEEIPDHTHKYLFLGHTYNYIDTEDLTFDAGVYQIDFSKYDMLLLGGDLLYNTSRDTLSMQLADDIYDLGSASTHLSVGNHDYLHPGLIQQFTKRPLYYSFHKNGITFIVLDTEEAAGSITGDQLQLIQNVADTIKQSSHLIVLHHKLIWLRGHALLEKKIGKANSSKGTCKSCLPPNNFHKDIYPLLRKISTNGIQVICIAGDLGINASRFEYKTHDGIVFLGSGIWGKSRHSNILMLYHNMQTKKIFWRFELLNDHL